MSFLNDLGKKISGAAEMASDKAKDFAEIASDKAKDFAEMASDKAKDLAEITKINYDISVLQKQVESDYAELGKLMFPLEKDNALSPAHELCEKIATTQQTIAELSAKIQQPEPVEEVEESEGEAPAATSAKKFCGNCGTEIIGEAKFCQACGTQIP